MADFLSDPHNLVKWDASVARVDAPLSRSISPGYTFTTFGPARGSSPGMRSLYRVVETRGNRGGSVALLSSAVFKTAVWTFALDPTPLGTSVTCEIDFTLRLRYLFLAPVFVVVNPRALRRDLDCLKRALEKG